MKFKKTKLTALAMSVLMAMSTITSVTWAADLFTDGAPAEVVVEEPVEVVSDGQEDVVAEDEALTGAEGDVLSSVFDIEFYVADNKVKARYRFEENGVYYDATVTQAPTPSKARNCYFPELAVYTASFKASDKPLTINTNGDGLSAEDKKKVKLAETCFVWTDTDGKEHDIRETETYSYVVDGRTFTSSSKSFDRNGGYIVVPGTMALGGKFGHSDPVSLTRTIESATCDKPGTIYNYRGCAWCGQAAINDNDKMYRDAAPNASEADWVAWLKNLGYTSESTPKSNHDFTGQTAQIVHDEYVDSKGVLHYHGGDLIIGSVKNNSAKLENGDFVRKHYTPYECHMESGKMVPDSSEYETDAFYYMVVKCKNCNTYKLAGETGKEYLVDVPGRFEKGTYYVQADNGNVAGFIGKDGTPYYFDGIKDVYEGFDGSIEIKIDNLKDPAEPILYDCTKLYRYYVRTYETDTKEPVTREVRGNDSGSYTETHAWGNVEIAPNGTKFTDGSVSATEDAKIGEWGKRQSINCKTNAKYQEGQQCIVCGVWKKVGDLKETGYNGPHTWNTDWSQTTDDADNKYYKIDDQTHKKFTYFHRTCDLCGFRDLKLANEYVEAHILTETKVEDGPKKDPTCGEDGFYTVQLECPCGFYDTESVKQTKIPATDAHDFGDNPAELQIIGDIQVGRGVQPLAGAPEGAEDPENRVYARIVRKCINCGEYDANGINNTPAGAVGDSAYNKVETLVQGRTFSDYVAAKADPTTHVPYPCSVGQVTVNFKWEGKVDGKATRLTGSKTVPYYINQLAFASARAHEPGEAVIENKVEATADTAGSYDIVLYCRVCGDEISRETKIVNPEEIIPVPTAKATPVNYNTISITWNAVEGATSYNVYYRSAALGVNDWTLAKNVTGTSFNYSGLITGVKYRFTVSAVKGENSSEFGVNTSVATPKLAAPEVKTVTAVKKGTKVTWTKVDGANGYIIQSKTASGKWTRVGTVKKGAKVSWIDKKAVSGTTYRVRAYRTVDAPNISKNNVYGPFSAAK